MGYPDTAFGMLKVTPEEQAVLVEAKPAMFEPVPGGWGRRGCTRVRLKSVDATTLRGALMQAWCNTAPKALIKVLNKDVLNKGASA